MASTRFVIPQFKGQETIKAGELIKQTLKSLGATCIREDKRRGVITFGLVDACGDQPDAEVAFIELLRELATKVHPNCIAMGYDVKKGFCL